MYGRSLIALVLASVTVCPAQVSVRTPTFSFGKPVLAVHGDFLGENGTTWLNANGAGTLVLSISNSGTATARGTVVMFAPGNALKDLQVVRVDSIGDLTPGEVRTKKITLSAAEDAPSQKGVLSIMVSARPGPVSVETKVEISVREIPAPRLDISISGGGDAVTAGEVSRITARVRNTGSGQARGVSATFLPAGPGTDAGLAETGTTVQLGTLGQGSSKEIALTLRPPAKAEGPAAFVVRLDEERAKFSVFVTLSVLVRTPLAGAEQSGYAAFKKGDYATAIASFERVVARGMAPKEVYFTLGLAYFKNRNRTRCLACMEKSSGLGSKEAKAWMREHTAPVQIPVVSYKQADPDPFDGYTPPIGLGVLPFIDSLKRDTPLTDKLYNALKARNEALRIFPFSTIKSEQVSWGLTSLNPSNRQILGALEKELSMNFAVAGFAHDTLGSAFSLQIIRCRDGAPVVTQEFRTTSASSAIDDAVMFILKGRVPVYTASRVVEVKLP
jgi:hypothetical protein